MSEGQTKKRYDLEDRTHEFARRIRTLVKQLPKTIANIEDCKQLIRSSGSIGANYIEANESLSKKDKLMRMKISRKEAKESVHWLRLLDTEGIRSLDDPKSELIQEGIELMKIFGSIVQKLR